MKISFYDKVQLACHIERTISAMKLPGTIEKEVYKDMESQIKREFGLNRKHPNLQKKNLYAAHELIDCYEIPQYVHDMISAEEK